MQTAIYSEALYLACCLARHHQCEAGIGIVEAGYEICRMPAPHLREAYQDRMERVRPTDPLPGNYTLPWLNEFVIEAAREALYADRGRGVPGGVYEPYLNHPDWTAAGLSLLVCAGPVEEHSDSHEITGHHCHFSVVLNDGYIARCPGDPLDGLPPQKAGDFFYLDIHEDHELVPDWRVDPADIDESLLGYAVMTMGRPHKLGEWEQRMQMILAFKELGDAFDYGVPPFHRKR